MPKVLIADGDEAGRQSLREEIERLGCASVAVSTGLLTEQLLKLNPDFDLAVIDSQLPDVGGRELIEKLRRETSLQKIPIIIISPMVRLRDVNELLALGASYFLPKPIKIPMLRDLVERVISRSK